MIPRPAYSSLFWRGCAIALLALLAVVLCSRLSHPWTYNDDYNGAFWSQAARNLSGKGFLATGGVPAPLYFGPLPVPREFLYVHHPTLLPGMMVLDRALLGESESAARLLPVFFSLLTAGWLWLFVSRAAGDRAAALVLGFFVAAPMELHYGQMVNFEAPELFFLLAALCSFHLWRSRDSKAASLCLIASSGFAMWTDWQGYLLVILLSGQLFLERSGRSTKLALALLLTAFVCGLAFLLQIHWAMPGAWGELFAAFRERTGRGDAAGGAFTESQWLATEFGYLTMLFHPAAWLCAGAYAVVVLLKWRQLPHGDRALVHVATTLFLLDGLYVSILRNQSFIHDFAGFYFLVPIAVLAGRFVEWGIRQAGLRWPGYPAMACAIAGCGTAAALIWSGIIKLDGIDTQFCILDDDQSEPATLMPDVGRLIDRTVPADAVVICNFDPYYSPLAYYARRTMVNGVRTYADWMNAVSDALPQPAAGILWTGAPDAAELLNHLPAGELQRTIVDGVPFALWIPGSKK